MATTYQAETPRLYLQRMTVEEHLEDFWELWNNPDALIWSPQSTKTTLEEAREFMFTTLPSEENPDIEKYALLLKPIPENPEPWLNSKGKRKMIGLVGTNRWSQQGLETGYCINIAYWGYGYASEAFSAFLKLFWAEPERKTIEHLVAKVDPGNIPSQKIVERVGARRGETLEGVFMGKGGRGMRDVVCWYLDRKGCEVGNRVVWEGRMRELEEEKKAKEGEGEGEKEREERGK